MIDINRMIRCKRPPFIKGTRTIYLSGPMTGLPEFNYPLFHDVARRLRAAGHAVYNPADYPHNASDGPFPIREAFAEYSEFICLRADMIVLLPGWMGSKGAFAERLLALNCQVEAIEWNKALEANINLQAMVASQVKA